MGTTINRDPFARADLVREKGTDGECAWCGRKGRRWVYRWERDSLYPARASWNCSGQFCSVGCFRDYNG